MSKSRKKTGRVYKPTRKRKRSDGTTYKWESARWYIRYYQQGELVTEPTPYTRKGDAEKLLRSRLSELDDAPKAKVDPKACTFEDLERLILDEYKVKNQKPHRVKTALINLRSHFRGMRAREITSSEWRTYFEKRRRQSAAMSTILNERAALSFMLKLAAEQDLINRVPKLRAQTARNEVKWLISDEDFAAVLREIAKEEDTLDIQHALSFLSWVPWRPNEVYGLRWDMVDLARGVIELPAHMSKNKQPRLLWFNGFDALRKLMRARAASRDQLAREQEIITPWVFHTESGDRTLLKRVNTVWKRAVHRLQEETIELGGPKYPTLMSRLIGDPPRESDPYVYLLKKVAQTRLERFGIGTKTVMKLAGHESAQSSLRYTQPEEAEFNRVWERLNAEVRFAG